MIPGPKKHMFRHKNRVNTFSKTFKSEFQIFHTRVCHLVVIVNISATTGPIWKKFFAGWSVRQALSIKWLTDSFPEVGYKNAQIFFWIIAE